MALRELAWLKIELSEEEEDTDAVVLEVAEPEADSFYTFDQVIECLGGTVTHSRQVKIANLVRPPPYGVVEPPRDW